MKDISERFPVAADHHLKNTGRHPEDTEMAIPCVRSHEILEVTTTERINAPNGICNAEPIVDSLVKDKSNGASAFSH